MTKAQPRPDLRVRDLSDEPILGEDLGDSLQPLTAFETGYAPLDLTTLANEPGLEELLARRNVASSRSIAPSRRGKSASPAAVSR